MNQNQPNSPSALERAEQAYSARIKFMQQIFLGMGGAIIFALVGSIGTKLLTTALMATGTSIALPALGLAGIAAIGLGCIFMGSKYLSRGIAIDQEAQARKIYEASQGRSGPDLAPTPDLEATKTHTLPPGASALHASETLRETAADRPDVPSPVVSQASYQQKLLASPQLARA